MKLSKLEINVLSFKKKLSKELISTLNKNFDDEVIFDILNFYEFCNSNVYSLRKRRSGESYFEHISRIAINSSNMGIKDKLIYFYYGIHDLEEENDILIKNNSNILNKNELKKIINQKYGKKLERTMDIFTPKPTNRKSKLSEKIFQSQIILNYDDIRLGVCKFFDTYDNTRDLNNLEFESLKGKLGQTIVLTDYFEKIEESDLIFLGNPNLKFQILDSLIERQNKIKSYFNLI